MAEQPLNSRWRGIAAATSALAAAALAAAIAGRGCDVDENSPAGVVLAFAAAAEANDRAEIYRLLGPTTRERLADATERATALVGGSRRFNVLELIGISSSSFNGAPRQVVVRHRTDKSAVVEITSAAGETQQLTVIESEGHWRIEVPSYRDGLSPNAEPETRQK